MRPVDPRLLRQATAARGFLAAAIGLGAASAGLVVAQAGLLARALAGAGLGIGLLAVVFARAAVGYGGEVTALRAAAAVKSQLRRALAARVLALGPAWLGRQGAGTAGEVTATATGGQVVLACLVPAVVLARIALADWLSAVVIAVTLPLIPAFGVLIGLHTRAQTQRQWDLLARLSGHFLDVVEGLPTLKLFGRARRQELVIAQVTDQHRAATMRTLRTAFLSALVLDVAATLATALVAVEVGLRLLAGHLTYQTALLVLLLTPEAYVPLRAVALHFHASQEGAAAAGRVLDILDTAPARTVTAGATVDLRTAPITFNAVSLAYSATESAVFADICLVVRAGERIAITGPSGAGKTSLLALLLRLAEPTRGSIDVGEGVDMRSVPLGAWRDQIAWVPQRPHLFDDTVAANIALGRPAATRAEVERAAGLAGAAEFIAALPHEYDTPVGERGQRLSSGQRQRIALARAFLRDAPLLLLDEPTAHLDPPAARALARTIDDLMAGRTVIHVTHDESLAATADRVFVLARGRLTELTPCPAIL